MEAKVRKINRKTLGGAVVGKIVNDARGNVSEVTLQFIDDVGGPTFRLNYHPKKHSEVAILHVHLTPTSEAIPIPFKDSINSLVRCFMEDPKNCARSLLQLAE